MSDEVFPYTNWTNVSFLENLYRDYKQNPEKVDSSWRSFFAGMEFVSEQRSFPKEEKISPVAIMNSDERVFRLVQAYRKFGHKKSSYNPLHEPLQDIDELALGKYGLNDLSEEVPSCGFLSQEKVPLSELVQALEKTYCQGIGFEIDQLPEDLSLWLRSHVEEQGALLTAKERLQIMDHIIRAEVLEKFIHTKYPGQMRFSLEGAETIIPMLHFLCDVLAELGDDEVVLGMAHRGRLNVLANVLGKSYFNIFGEFEDLSSEEGSGDVKYHKGAHISHKTRSGKYIEITLSPNASHLESVDPIVEGITRAKQDQKKKAAAVLIHGDASLAGQGVIYETLQLSKLKGYSTKGTLHIVLNNHIGYTTLPKEARSTLYCTDIAKTFGFPVFHVNAERPEECVVAIFLAAQIRSIFHTDVFIDLNCYRKYGHNEGDEPMYTQPLEYKKIKQKKTIRELFEEELLAEGILTKEGVLQKEDAFKALLHEAMTKVVAAPKVPKEMLPRKQSLLDAPTNSLSVEKLQELATKLFSVPEEFHIHPKLKKLLQERKEIVKDPMQSKIDWGTAELLAYASLLTEETTVRLSGQDVQRGTFSHRHSVWVDQETTEKYFPLNHLEPEQSPFFCYNSPLSEFAVLGFELGYSQTHTQALVLWEAQFGDFFNGAQVIVDQYLAATEQKWMHRSNLTLLLPHGYEGKGPEHSSARIERFLQLCAEDNLIVANCTTPSQLFHLIRRQAYLIQKRPLIIFTPKLLLRHPSCVSSLRELAHNQFAECLQDDEWNPICEKIVLCSGKVYYDLVQERNERKKKEIAFIRLEQLYPFPFESILSLLEVYSQIKDIVWVQEEPQNMGAWSYIKEIWQDERFKTYASIRYVGRERSASPATGSYLLHKKQYEHFMWQVFEG